MWRLLTRRQLSADVRGQRGGRRVVVGGGGRQLHRERRQNRVPELHRPQRVQPRLQRWAMSPVQFFTERTIAECHLHVYVLGFLGQSC